MHYFLEKHSVLLHFMKQKPECLAQPQGTEILSVADTIESACNQEILQTAILSFPITCPNLL